VESVKFHEISERKRPKTQRRKQLGGKLLNVVEKWLSRYPSGYQDRGVNSNSNLGPSRTFRKLGCLRRKQLGSKLLHVVEKWFPGLLWLP